MAAVGAWLTFHHKPAWYQPGIAEDLPDTRRRVLDWIDEVSDGMVRGEPFEVVLSDRDVNEWLAAAPRMWPEEAERLLPSQVHDPAVRFQDGKILIGAHLSYRGWQAIVGAHFRPEISPDAQEIRLTVIRVTAGSLPMPRALVHRMLDAGLRRLDLAAGRRPGSGEDVKVGPSSLGFTWPNRFVWPNGERPFRILTIEAVADGQMRLRVRPLNGARR